VIPENQQLAESNRIAEHLTTVLMTGVTALVRGTASWMEYYDSTYPAMFIGDTLREADILHISNEVPFAEKCPYPYPWDGLVFCSRTKYIGLLDSIGTDVVELSGDHFQDWGEDAMLLTLKMYDERGWPYYGGGHNRAEAEKPALFENNGNKIAFLGCNAKAPGYAGADEDTPGAVHCDFDELTAAIKKVKVDGYLPIVTFQHLEYYSYEAHPILQADFKRVADAGAVIVSGSQAHQPHAIAFQEEGSASQDASFLHYGLGNLFFDQYQEGYPERQAFMDRHVIYEGRHISTELLTILFVDLARARPMTPDERADLLTTIFKASGWTK
jgi:poly-gamma-glutamate synthesis protein (capsule biosynthesis protein)